MPLSQLDRRGITPITEEMANGKSAAEKSLYYFLYRDFLFTKNKVVDSAT